jgi:glycerophosphoryl diester phosphodiesterase
MKKLSPWGKAIGRVELIHKPIAHRGFHSGDGTTPENSIASFREAIEANLPFELDVHLLKDGGVVVFHDDDLERMTGMSGQITRLTTHEVRTLRLLESNHRIPLLEEVLEEVNGKVTILIEIKNDPRIESLARAVSERLKCYHGPAAIQAFNPFALKWFYENQAEIPRGQLAGDFRDESMAFYKKFLLQRLMMNRFSKPDFIAYDHRCLPFPAVSKARSRGLPVLGWTVRSTKERDHAMRFCDNIIFEGFNPW